MYFLDALLIKPFSAHYIKMEQSAIRKEFSILNIGENTSTYILNLSMKNKRQTEAKRLSTLLNLAVMVH